jgi:hypothetical protein
VYRLREAVRGGCLSAIIAMVSCICCAPWSGRILVLELSIHVHGCFRINYRKRLADDANLDSSPAGNTWHRRLLQMAGDAVDGNYVAEGDVERSAMEQSAENRSVASLHNVSTVARNRLPRGKCFITILDLCVCLALLLMFHSILAYSFCDVVSFNFSL